MFTRKQRFLFSLLTFYDNGEMTRILAHLSRRANVDKALSLIIVFVTWHGWYYHDPDFVICFVPDIDDCKSAPCLHEGVCSDGINEFSCQCTEGYNGPTCANSTYFTLS